MTEQIKSAIKELERTRDTRVFFPKDISMKLAIRSLNVWEEVLTELRSTTVDNIHCDSKEEAIGIGKGLTYAIDIIKQKLAEIEE